MRLLGYGRALAVAGRIARGRRLPNRGPVSSPTTRRVARLIDAYLERHDDLRPGLRRRLLELDGFLGGLSIADTEDSGNAGFSWVRSMLIRIAARPTPPGELPATDKHLAKLYELLGREYVRFADWSTAAECFSGSAIHWRTPRHKRRTFCQVVVCTMKAGDRAAAAEHLEIIAGATHPPSRVFHRIAARVLDETPDIAPAEIEGLRRVHALGIVPYAYLASVLAERLAADGRPERALGLISETITHLTEERADSWVIGDLEQQAALIWAALDRHEDSLRLALGAWAKLDAQRYRACSHNQRLSLWRGFGPARRAALKSAVALGDGRAVAELIESCRLQSLIGATVEVDGERDKLADSGFTTPDQATEAVGESRAAEA
ncbi:hypothetical protein ACWF94_30075, partial [Streptomyces sp. NPDC055078]